MCILNCQLKHKNSSVPFGPPNLICSDVKQMLSFQTVLLGESIVPSAQLPF